MPTRGPIDARQARRYVTTAAELGRRRRHGLVRQHRGVYARPAPEVPPGSHAHFLVRCVAALEAAGSGAQLSHRFGGALHGVRERPAPGEAPAVRVPPGANRRTRSDLVVHRTDRPGAHDEILGLRVTTLPRTLIDLAAVERLAEVVLALARAEAALVLDMTVVAAELRTAAGTPGIPALLEALEIVARCGPVIRSLLEAELLVLCLRAGLPMPAANARVETGVGWFEVDALWARQRVVVETDGFVFHSAPGRSEARRRFVADRARWSAIEAAGYRVLVYAWDHVRHAPHLVRAQVAATLARPAAART